MTTSPASIMRVPVEDSGLYANFLDSSKFEHLQRLAAIFANSTLIPTHLQGKIADCAILIEMAFRLKQSPLAFLQKCYVVHGKPGMEAQLLIGLMNTSGLFSDSVDYEVEGEDPKDQKYRVRAFAVRKSTGKTLYGPWVDWPTVKGEGWLDKSGSKWKTMPAMMFMYRAASWFSRVHCPEAGLGMQTVDEIQDIEDERPRRDVTPKESKTEALAERITKARATSVDPSNDSVPSTEPDAKPDATEPPTEEVPPTNPEPVTTKPQKTPDDSMPADERLVIRMTEVYGCDDATARRSLDAWCQKTFKKPLVDAVKREVPFSTAMDYVAKKAVDPV